METREMKLSAEETVVQLMVPDDQPSLVLHQTPAAAWEKNACWCHETKGAALVWVCFSRYFFFLMFYCSVLDSETKKVAKSYYCQVHFKGLVLNS